jgi:tRNA A-37 threonylcarbamoyl transferase component Bud32
MTSLTPLQPGNLLQQRYRITRQIGRGGMGAVYDVIDERLNSRVALKQILRSEPTLRQAFEREARLLANLQHRSLPRVINSFAEAESDFIVMDYIAGDDLLTMVNRDGAMPVEQVLAYADQLLQVLAYLHGRNPPILHRDIKPENIKITAQNQLFLLDFGIAKGSAGVNPTTGDDLSVAAFSAAYAPIEQQLSGQTTIQSDLFSVGATLYHLLTGQRPVAADQRQQATNEGVPDPLIPCHRINSRIPEGVGTVIQRALAFHAADRYASADAVRRALQTLPRQSDLFAAPELTELGTENAPLPAKRAPTPLPNPPIRPAPPTVPARAVMRTASRTGQPTLQKRIDALIRQVFERYPGAWLFWCDPRGDWRPLIERVAGDERMGGFPLVLVTEHLSHEIGGLQARQSIQAHIDAGESFVVLAQTSADHLGWLWGHALLAEQRYHKSLREQLLEWGWRPQSPTTSEDEIALLGSRDCNTIRRPGVGAGFSQICHCCWMCSLVAPRQLPMSSMSST